MRALLTLRKGSSISFVHDVEALGLLLYELLDFFAKPNTTIMVGEIHMLTRKLGYDGPISVVRRVLISQGFLTEVERGTCFILLSTNREAINHFFKKQKQVFEGFSLTPRERGILFGSTGIQGTPTEGLLARVMGTLALLGEYLARVPQIELKVRGDVAKYMVSTALFRDRSEWHVERTGVLKQEFESIVNLPGATDKEIDECGSRYLKATGQAIVVFEEAVQHVDLYNAALRDAQILKILRDVRKLLLQVTASFSKDEGEI